MMKKLFVISLLCAGMAMAQRGGGSKGGDSGGAPGGMGGPQSKFDRIAAALMLSKDQKKAAKAILDEGAKESAPLREQITKTRVSLGESIVAKKSDDELKASARTTAEASSKLTQLELDTFSKLVATLDDTQKANKQALGQVLVMMNDIYHVKSWNED